MASIAFGVGFNALQQQNASNTNLGNQSPERIATSGNYNAIQGFAERESLRNYDQAVKELGKNRISFKSAIEKFRSKKDQLSSKIPFGVGTIDQEDLQDFNEATKGTLNAVIALHTKTPKALELIHAFGPMKVEPNAPWIGPSPSDDQINKLNEECQNHKQLILNYLKDNVSAEHLTALGSLDPTAAQVIIDHKELHGKLNEKQLATVRASANSKQDEFNAYA